MLRLELIFHWLLRFKQFNHILTYLYFLLLSLTVCSPPTVLSNKEILLGDEAANKHNFASAISHYKNFYKINQQLGIYRNFERESEVLLKIGYANLMIGQFDSALVFFTNAAQIDSNHGDWAHFVNDLRSIGNCYLYMGDYRKGFSELNRCISLSNKYEKGLKQTSRLIAANVYLSFGNCYAILSQYDSSDFYLNRAAKIFQEENENYGLIIALLKLGINKVDLCDYNNSSILINQSMNIAKSLKLSISEHLFALGNIYSETGDYDKALAYKKQSLLLADSSGNISQSIICNISLGDLYNDIGDSKTALIFYNYANDIIMKNDVNKKDASAIIATRKGEFNKSLDFYNESGATYSKAITLLKISVIYFEKKAYDSCLCYLAQTSTIMSDKNKSDVKTLINIYKSASLIETGKFDEVMPILDSAKKSNQNSDNEWKILYYRGRIYESNNDLYHAEISYKKAIDIIEDIRNKIQSDEIKSFFLDKRIDVYDRLIRLLNKQNRHEESFNYVEKARSRAFLDMLDRQKQVITYHNSDSGLANEEHNLKLRLVKLKEKLINYSTIEKNEYATTNPTIGILENELTKATDDYSNFLDKIKSQHSKLIQLIKPDLVNAQSVIAENDSNTTLLEYWLSHDNLYIWCLNKSGVHFAKVLLKSSNIDLLNSSHNFLQNQSKETLNLFRELYKILIVPIHPFLKENSNLVIVPHSILHFLPFHALIDEKNTTMVEHYYISYIPSASILSETRKNQHFKERSLLAMAIGKIAVNGNPPLDSTISEVKKITELFEHSVSRIETECTIDNFKAYAPYCTYIHLATHGYYNSIIPFSSCILFNPTKTNDGKLKVSDIFGLRLNANLVTLSACVTGLGNISNSDELIGLSRAFIYAGTPAIIVSLWSVADAQTSELMTYFYEFLKKNPANIALTLAQRKLMTKYEAPYFWAPFEIIGSSEKM
jgi:CHAT domain-containing protein/predicted negative regulator of RcsB-dependent stress response